MVLNVGHMLSWLEFKSRYWYVHVYRVVMVYKPPLNSSVPVIA